MNRKKILVGKLLVFLTGLAIILPLKNFAQEIKTDATSPLKRIGEIVRDENGNALYRIEGSIKFGYIYELMLYNNSILTDSVTGLQWRKKPRASLYETKHSWYETQAWVDEMQHGWRLPTLKELQEFFDNHYRWYPIVWSSEEHEKDKNKALVFNLDSGPVKDFTGKIAISTARKDLDIGEFGNCTPLAVREAIQNRVTKYALKVTPLTTEIKPDGKTSVQISAQLYSYAPGDNSSSKPLSGKPLTFEINDRFKIKPGSLSANSAITNANGMVTFTYTAPTTETLDQLEPWNRMGTSIKISNGELNVEDLAYIKFVTDKGKVLVEPAQGISDHGIVPPDRRYPAEIRAYFDDENLNPRINADVVFSITGSQIIGMLRAPDGVEGKRLTVKTDASGWAKVNYFYAADTPPEKPITETIEIRTSNTTIPLKAYVSTGLNIVFENVENAYEGKGIINAGEEIPIRVKIKDAWNPSLDLEEIISYWGLGTGIGNSLLLVKLEIENISTVPDYLLDQLKLQQYPEQAFIENMKVRSFKEEGIPNMLWMREGTIKGYQGYPRIRPSAVGNHYYEAKVTLTDQNGKEVFVSKHPASKAYFNVQTGLPADATMIFFISNPFEPQTREAKLLATALDLMGFGAFLSVIDALYKINAGDTEGLYSSLFSEIKGVFFDKVKSASAYHELAVDLYSGIALAEKVDQEIMKDKTGPIAEMEESIFQWLYNSYKLYSKKLVILRGSGNQKLIELVDEGSPEKNEVGIANTYSVKITSSNPDKKTPEAGGDAIKANGKEIPTKELQYLYDYERNTVSFKNGNVSIYIIPEKMKVRHENTTEIKRY